MPQHIEQEAKEQKEQIDAFLTKVSWHVCDIGVSQHLYKHKGNANFAWVQRFIHHLAA